jgi:hypothetical protein
MTSTKTSNPLTHGEGGKSELPEMSTSSNLKFSNTSPKNMRTKRNSVSLTGGAFKQRLKRLNVQDAKTGLSLYEKIWRWGGNESLDGVDALVATFHQFAATIDKSRAGVSRVVFELPTELSKHSGRQAARNNQNHLRLKATMALREKMEMVVSANDSLRIVLFHDITKGGDMERIDDLVLDIKQQFTTMYESELKDDKLREMLTKVYQSNPSDERNALQKEICTRFVSFGDYLTDQVIAKGSFR